MSSSTRSQYAADQRQAPHPMPTWLSGSWLLDGTPARSPWRALAAIGAVGEAVAHIPVIEEHLSEAPYIGVGFVLLAVAGLILAHLLLTADTTAVWVSTLIVSALALAGYFLSRTVGLPQIRDDISNWNDPLGFVAIATEAMMLITAVIHLTYRRWR